MIFVMMMMMVVVVVVMVMIVIITDVDYGKLSFAGQPLADKFTGKAPVPLYVCLSVLSSHEIPQAQKKWVFFIGFVEWLWGCFCRSVPFRRRHASKCWALRFRPSCRMDAWFPG
jgi:hypothetical protein